MAEKIYFQWQNEVLRKTIYRQRELKLRHFLLYYKEIDLWAEYKNKKTQDLSKEKAEFEEAQKGAISNAYKSEQKLRAYFKVPIAYNSEQKLREYFEDPIAYNAIQKLWKYLKDPIQPSVTDTDSKAGKDEMERVKKLLVGLHTAFQENFPNYEEEEDESRDRKEKYFVATRLAEWEGYLKELNQKITKKKNIRDHPDTANKGEKQKELDILEKTVRTWVEAELDQLKKFVSAQNRLEKRKAEFAQRQKALLKRQDEILKVLEPLQKLIETWAAELERIKNTLVRLTNPPKLDDVINYFSEGKLYDKIERRFGQGQWKWEKPVIDEIQNAVRKAFGDVIESLHNEILPFIHQWKDREKKDAWPLQRLKNHYDKTVQARKQLDKVILELDAKNNALRASLEEKKKSLPVDSRELQPLEDKLGIRQKASSVLSGAGMRELLEGELNKLADLQIAIGFLVNDKETWKRGIQDQESELEKLQKDISKNAPEVSKKKKELEPITSDLEIKREKYLSEYMPARPVNETEKDQKKEEEKLKREIVQFLAEKENARLEKLNHDQLLHEVFQRFWKEPERFPLWLQYMVVHFSGMRYASAHDSWYDPKALLLDLRTMDIQERLKSKEEDQAKEMNYDVDDMTPEQVLEELKSYEDQLPPWMWKEIVEVTDLRLTEVTDEDEDWENLSSDEQKERNSNREKKNAQYRQIMEKWKKDNMTGWRKEHDRANRLIVTRAVCNEVAEHIQHLRGHEGAAGLAEKPGWYMGEEKKYYEAKDKRPAGSRPYFVKAKDRNDFEIGASILWLRFVHESPDQWRVAKPLETREGDGLIPDVYLGRSMDSGGWAYKMGGPIIRTRTKTTTNKKGSSKGGKENQWLRWLHEATVVEVAETAETGENDKVVLTFETALPDDDHSHSTIGLFKRYLSDLTREQVEDSYNAAFVGFVPEREIPPPDLNDNLQGDLEEMLDWNHILQKEVVSATELEVYRNRHIRNRKLPKPTIEIIDPVERVKGKADQPICEFAKWTDGLLKEANKNLYKVRIWGDKKLKGLDVNIVDTTNFQAVGVYVKEIGQRGGVSNFLKIGRDDIDKLIAMQIEDEFIRKRSDRKRPKIWLEQKMNWLCKGEGTIYFTKGGKGWETAESILWGTIALGGNLVQVEGEPEPMVFKVEGGEKKEIMMVKLVGFRKSDWYRPLDELLAEGLVHRCFCAYSNNTPRDTPQGIVYSPFFSPQDWDFSGTAKPSAFYLPVDQLVGPEEAKGNDYKGIAQNKKLKCEE